MARGGAGDIPGNVTGQDITSSSLCTHVQGAYGAPTGAVGGAKNGRRTNPLSAPVKFGAVSLRRRSRIPVKVLMLQEGGW